MISEAKKKADKKYAQSEKGKIAHKKALRKWCKTVKGKVTLAKATKKYHMKNLPQNKQILRNLKANGCAICGYNTCSASLDFHHVNEESKKFNIGTSALCRNNKSIIEELNKCILLCANCHRKIHYEELD